MADVMKLSMILSATDKMSRVIDMATKKSTDKLTMFQKKANAMGAKMQKIGAGMAAAGGAITGALFADVASMAAKAKQIEFSAQKVGMSAENFQKFSGFAEKMGVEMAGLEMAFGRLSKAQVAAAMGNQSAQKIFRAAGISLYDSNGKFRNTADILLQLSERFKKVQDGPKKTALAMMLFGRSGKDLIPMLNQGSAAMKDFGAKMDKYGVTLTVEQLAQFKKYRAAMAENKMAMLGIKTTIATSVLPVVIKYMDKIAKLASRVSLWTQKHKALTKTILTIAGATGVLLTVLGTFLVTAGTIFRSINMLVKIWNVAKFAVFALRFGIFNLMSTLKALQIGTKIMTAVQWLWNAAMSANPIGLIIVGIAALVAIVAVCWKKFAWFRAGIKTAWETVKGFGNILKEFVIDRIKGIISGLGAVGRAIGLLFKGKFAEAGKVALGGLKDLSGVTAVQNAVKHTVQLGKGVSGTYNKIYAQEKAAEKPQSKAMAAIQSLNVSSTQNIQRAAVNNSPVVHYAPVINMNGGSASSKQDFSKMLNDHKNELEQMMKKIGNNQQRTSFSYQ